MQVIKYTCLWNSFIYSICELYNWTNYLQENFTLVSSTSRYATRSSSNRNFIVPQISTYEAGTFYYSAIKDWTGLPVNIKEITNKGTFKDALKQYLKQQSRECEEDSFVYF